MSDYVWNALASRADTQMEAEAEAERRHQGLDGGRHHRDTPPLPRAARPHCGCGCEDQPDDDAYDPPARNLRGYEAILHVEFRAVSP
jgi:hypothetical protein